MMRAEKNLSLAGNIPSSSQIYSQYEINFGGNRCKSHRDWRFPGESKTDVTAGFG
jgi:hypothetical protein